MTNQIQKEDVLRVASDLHISLNKKCVQWVLDNYDGYLKQYPTENWSFIVEIAINDIPDELKPKTFYFQFDQKVTAWKRTEFEVEADNYEDAKLKAVKMIGQNELDKFGWQTVEGTTELMGLGDNDGFNTEELLDVSGNVVWHNGKM